jgi:tRNA (cmo5U34)-methyltransferase
LVKNINTGDDISSSLSSWTFGGNTAPKFDEHVKKSVPGYEFGHELICKYFDFFVNIEPKKVYDLGCSTGTLINKLNNRHNNAGINFIGIDEEKKMLEIANRKTIKKTTNSIDFQDSNLYKLEFDKCSSVISYYTIQFIAPHYRQELINKIYKSLSWGGAFFLFEKTRRSDARFQDMSNHVYNEYKLSMGYSSEEIVGKSRSLAGILEPFSTQGNIDLLKRAGFIDIECIFTSFCFTGWLCIK